MIYLMKKILFLECKTIKSGKDCIFPFKYKGTTYNKCTKAESENGQPWCATRHANIVLAKTWTVLEWIRLSNVHSYGTRH